MDRRIREEQDLAFQQSLLEDQLREREAEEQRKVSSPCESIRLSRSKREEEERERALREQQQAEAAVRVEVL